jgi:hypothetical protein
MQYRNSHTDHLDSIKRHVETTVVAPAAAFAAQPADLQTQLDATIAEFTATPSKTNGEEVIRLQHELRDATTLAVAIENVGGSSEIRLRELRTPEVFAVFVDAFAEKVELLKKLTVPGLRKLGQRRLALTENGMHSGMIELDAVVRAWLSYIEFVRAALADAVFGARYCVAQGKEFQSMSFDQLYASVTTAIPVPPSS